LVFERRKMNSQNIVVAPAAPPPRQHHPKRKRMCGGICFVGCGLVLVSLYHRGIDGSGVVMMMSSNGNELGFGDDRITTTNRDKLVIPNLEQTATKEKPCSTYCICMTQSRRHLLDREGSPS
jgi:hypothetical protein